MSKREFETLESKVLTVLMTSPTARDSDKVLYVKFLEMYFPEALDMSYREAINANVPNYESLGRIRRKLQSQYPEVHSSRQIEKLRKQREQEFREYARI